MIGGKMKIM